MNIQKNVSESPKFLVIKGNGMKQLLEEMVTPAEDQGATLFYCRYNLSGVKISGLWMTRGNRGTT